MSFEIHLYLFKSMKASVGASDNPEGHHHNHTLYLRRVVPIAPYAFVFHWEKRVIIHVPPCKHYYPSEFHGTDSKVPEKARHHIVVNSRLTLMRFYYWKSTAWHPRHIHRKGSDVQVCSWKIFMATAVTHFLGYYIVAIMIASHKDQHVMHMRVFCIFPCRIERILIHVRPVATGTQAGRPRLRPYTMVSTCCENWNDQRKNAHTGHNLNFFMLHTSFKWILWVAFCLKWLLRCFLMCLHGIVLICRLSALLSRGWLRLTWESGTGDIFEAAIQKVWKTLNLKKDCPELDLPTQVLLISWYNFVGTFGTSCDPK